MKVKSYRELIVWQKAMDFVVVIYQLCSNFPDDEKYGLTNQMKRAAVSIPSNIAEGQSRSSTKDFIRFLYIAKGSNAELETQLEIAVRLGFVDTEKIKDVIMQSNEIGKMLTGLIKSLSQLITNH